MTFFTDELRSPVQVGDLAAALLDVGGRSATPGRCTWAGADWSAATSSRGWSWPRGAAIPDQVAVSAASASWAWTGRRTARWPASHAPPLRGVREVLDARRDDPADLAAGARTQLAPRGLEQLLGRAGLHAERRRRLVRRPAVRRDQRDEPLLARQAAVLERRAHEGDVPETALADHPTSRRGPKPRTGRGSASVSPMTSTSSLKRRCASAHAERAPVVAPRPCARPRRRRRSRARAPRSGRAAAAPAPAPSTAPCRRAGGPVRPRR